MTDSLVGFALVAGLMTLVPGLDTALVLSAAIRSRRAAYATLAGVCTGLFVWGIAGAIGVSALLAASQFAYDILRFGGAAYMAGLGIMMVARTFSRRRVAAPVLEHGAPVETRIGSAFRRGLLTNLLNPKIGVFYAAVLPQFIPAGADALGSGALLALVHVAEGMIWFSVIILSVHLMRQWLSRPRTQRWMDRITGLTLVGFGAGLALDHK